MARKVKKKKGKGRQKQQRRGSSRQSRAANLALASSWPLHEVLLSREWQKEGALVQIIVARRSIMGQIAIGTFLIDLGCLGVKSAFAAFFSSQQDYQQRLRSQFTAGQEMMPADLNLVVKIINAALDYAGQFGIKPDPDYRQAMVIVGQADPDACTTPIPLGKDGKPFFVAGPNDNSDAIIRKLTKVCGADGFHYVVPFSGDIESFFRRG